MYLDQPREGGPVPDSNTTTPDAHSRAKAQAVARLMAMPDQQFDNTLASAVMDDMADLLEAFRSPELAERSERSLDFMIRTNAARVRHTLAGDAARQKRYNVQFFINKVARERAVLRQYLTARDAQAGILRNRDNPRARAMKRLAQLNMKGDVPQGTFRRLLEEEQEKAAERKREMRRAAKERVKQLKAQQRQPVR